MLDPSGAEVFWDYQVGTFTGILGELKVGLSGGDIVTVLDLETRLGVDLSAETGAHLQEDMLKIPFTGGKRFVTKLQFMDLFMPADLARIYAMARNTDPDYLQLSIGVQIELDRVNRAPDGLIELTDPRTVKGLNNMATYQLIQEVGGAARIAKGIPWQQ